ICLRCKFCISPKGARRHLLRWHKDLSMEVRRELQSYCAGLDLVEPKDVVNPSDKASIYGLQLHAGSRCAVPRCDYICTKESTAMVHARGHGWVKGKPKTWVETSVQVRWFGS